MRLNYSIPTKLLGVDDRLGEEYYQYDEIEYEPDDDEVEDFIASQLEYLYGIDKDNALEMANDLDIWEELEDYFYSEIEDHFKNKAIESYYGDE